MHVMNIGKSTRILVTAKTYPLPSKKYNELVCTGGVLEDGTFIRIYPIDYRYRSKWEQYKKYQWIEVDLEKNSRDTRPESYSLKANSKIELKEYIPPDNNWAERKKYVLAKGVHNMCWLQDQKQDKVSLGIIRPKQILDFIIEEDSPDWKGKWKILLNELTLFGPTRKPLDKIPFKFKYKYLCEDKNCKGHTQTIFDWEVGQLYRRLKSELRDEKEIFDKIRLKLFDKICASNIDTHFFVGTIKKFGSWVIVGLFYPKKEQLKSQLNLDI